MKSQDIDQILSSIAANISSPRLLFIDLPLNLEILVENVISLPLVHKQLIAQSVRSVSQQTLVSTIISGFWS